MRAYGYNEVQARHNHADCTDKRKPWHKNTVHSSQNKQRTRRYLKRLARSAGKRDAADGWR